MAGNVFGLNEVYDLQKDNATDDALELNIPGLSHGYVCGGGGPYIDTINKIDFQTEVVSSPGNNLSQARGYQPGGVSSGNYGYVCGGWTGSANTSTIDRVDFTNDTVSNPGNPLGRTNYSVGAVSGPVYGYIAGGTSPTVCTITRIDFSSDTVSANPVQLTQNRAGMAGMQNPSYGYFAGGLPLVCTIDRLDFSNDTVSDAGDLPRAIWFFNGVSSSDYGYTAGGNTPGYNYFSDVYRIDFSNDNVTTISANLDVDKYGATSTQSLDFGYWAGGYDGPGSGGYDCVINRLDFSNETMSQPSPQLPIARNARAGVQANRPQVFKYVPGNNVWKEEPNYGYTAGGADPSVPENISDIQRLDFSSETTSLPGSNLVTSQKRFTQFASNSNYGYVAGGYNPSSSNVSDIERLDFSNEIVVRSPSNFSVAKRASTGFSSPNYGYWHGGLDTNPGSCILERLDFSTEVRTNSTVAGQARQNAGSMFTNGYGYIAGGYESSVRFDIIKIDVSTETGQTLTSKLTEGDTPSGRNTCRGFSGASYGYIAGGQPDSSIIDRLDFATESTTRVADLTTSVSQAAAMGSFGFGYVAGGNDPGTFYSLIQRLDYTTETVSSPSNNLPRITAFAGGSASGPGGISTKRVGKPQYGYTLASNLVCTIDRLEFATETVRQPSSGTTRTRRAAPAGVSNSNYGYVLGGYEPTAQCIVDRLDFSNETVSLPGNNLPKAVYRQGCLMNYNYGYSVGGGFGGGSAVQRLDFETEVIVRIADINRTINNQEGVSNATETAGYVVGGYSPSSPNYKCNIDRLDFSNDTFADTGNSSPTGYSSQGQAMKDANYGYFAAAAITPAPLYTCRIQRLDFTTDSFTTANSGSLPVGTGNAAKIFTNEYGYVMGGSTPSDSSAIHRLEFASGTVSTPSQSMTRTRTEMSAVQNI